MRWASLVWSRGCRRLLGLSICFWGSTSSKLAIGTPDTSLNVSLAMLSFVDERVTDELYGDAIALEYPR